MTNSFVNARLQERRSHAGWLAKPINPQKEALGHSRRRYTRWLLRLISSLFAGVVGGYLGLLICYSRTSFAEFSETFLLFWLAIFTFMLSNLSVEKFFCKILRLSNPEKLASNEPNNSRSTVYKPDLRHSYFQTYIVLFFVISILNFLHRIIAHYIKVDSKDIFLDLIFLATDFITSLLIIALAVGMHVMAITIALTLTNVGVVEISSDHISAPTFWSISRKNISWEDIKQSRYINLYFFGILQLKSQSTTLQIPTPLQRQDEFRQQVLAYAGAEHPLSIALENYHVLRASSRTDVGYDIISGAIRKLLGAPKNFSTILMEILADLPIRPKPLTISRKLFRLLALISIIPVLLFAYTLILAEASSTLGIAFQEDSKLYMAEQSLTINREGTVAIYVNSNLDIRAGLTRTKKQFISRQIYKMFPDVFDFIILVSNNVSIPKGVYHSGRYRSVKNTIKGIGDGQRDYTSSFGSAGRLQGVIELPYRFGIDNGPILHELAHRWGNYILLGDTDPDDHDAHWDFYTGLENITSRGSGGQLYGFDATKLCVAIGDPESGGIFSIANLRSSTTSGNHKPYADLELYLMGLIDKHEVGNTYIPENPRFGWTDRDTGISYFAADRIRIMPPEEILPEERIPGTDSSPKHFRGIVVLIDNIQPHARDIDHLNRAITRFALPANDQHKNFFNFYEATLGRATIQLDGLWSIKK